MRSSEESSGDTSGDTSGALLCSLLEPVVCVTVECQCERGGGRMFSDVTELEAFKILIGLHQVLSTC